MTQRAIVVKNSENGGMLIRDMAPGTIFWGKNYPDQLFIKLVTGEAASLQTGKILNGDTSKDPRTPVESIEFVVSNMNHLYGK